MKGRGKVRDRLEKRLAQQQSQESTLEGLLNLLASKQFAYAKPTLPDKQYTGIIHQILVSGITDIINSNQNTLLIQIIPLITDFVKKEMAKILKNNTKCKMTEEEFKGIQNIIDVISANVKGVWTPQDNREYFDLLPLMVELLDTFQERLVIVKDNDKKEIDVLSYIATQSPVYDHYQFYVKYMLINNRPNKGYPYINLFKQLGLIYIKNNPSNTNNENAILAGYYASLAYYALLTDVGPVRELDINLCKAEAAVTEAMTDGILCGELLNQTYKLLMKRAQDRGDYQTAIHYQTLYRDNLLSSLHNFNLIKQGKINNPFKFDVDVQINLLTKELDECRTVLKNLKTQLVKQSLLVEEAKAKEHSVEQTTSADKHSDKTNTSDTYSDIEGEDKDHPNKLVDDIKDGKKEVSNKATPPSDDTDDQLKKKKKKKKKSKKETKKKTEPVIPKPEKTILFNDQYEYKEYDSTPKVFKLHGTTVHRTYVCVKQEVIDSIKQEDKATSTKVLKWLKRMCERGKVVGASKGQRCFVVKSGKVKLKDASKSLRFFGKEISKVNVNEKEYTLLEIDGYNLTKKKNNNKIF